MSIVARTASLARLVLAVVCALSGPVADTARAEEDDARWTLSLSLSLVAQAQDAAGAVESSFPARTTFEPQIQDEPLILVPAFPLGLRIDGPAISVQDRRVRPFFHARAILPMDRERTIARQGTLPDPVEIPDSLPGGLSAENIAGQGSLLRAKLDVSGQVGLGAAVDLSIADLPFQLALSLDYMLQEMSLDGDVIYVRGTGAGEQAPFTIQHLHRIDRARFHFLGPRAELATRVWQEPAFSVEVFAELGTLFAVGDVERSFRASDDMDSARFRFEVDPWIVQAGVGLRLTWRGLQ